MSCHQSDRKKTSKSDIIMHLVLFLNETAHLFDLKHPTPLIITTIYIDFQKAAYFNPL